MNHVEKKEFIKPYIKNVSNELLSKVDSLPENWDGWEIRHWIAKTFINQDRFSDSNLSTLMKRRRRECRNDIIVNNL